MGILDELKKDAITIFSPDDFTEVLEAFVGQEVLPMRIECV